MHNFETVISSLPNALQVDRRLFQECVDACVDCELACISCADACLAEQQLDMLRRCVRLDLDCAEICGTSARLLARVVSSDFGVLKSLLKACAQACDACAAECERHAHHAHCGACAKACRTCEDACEQFAQALPALA